MTGWPDFQFHRLVRVPAPDRPADRDDDRRRHPGAVGPLAASLIGSHAALLAAGHPDAAFLTAWVRAEPRGPLRFLVGGRPYFPPAVGAAEPRALLFPPGAAAVTVPAGEAAGLLDRFPCWVPCGARPDALWSPANGKPGAASVPRGSFDRHAAHLPGPFAWLVIAAPLAPRQLKPELDRLVNEILPLSRGEVGEAKRIELERKQARYRELSRAQGGAGWRVQVLVGGEDPRAAGTAAAMLCAAAELHGLPYVLEPGGPPAAFPGVRPDPANPAAFTTGTELLVALARPPERELPGVRLVEPPRFDVTPDAPGSTGLPLGSVLDEARAPVGELVLDLDALNRHTFVCGATGAGKSMTVRHLLAEANRAGLPWLVIEPAKAEYARMAGRLADLDGAVVVIRPGAVDSPPAGFNPLEPTPGFPLQTHVDTLRALFLAAFEAQEPFPQVLATALTRCYEELGWDLTLGEPVHKGHNPRWPTLADLQRVADTVVREVGYGKDIADNVRGFIKVRLGSLRLGTTGRFFQSGHRLDLAELHRRNVVLEIEDVGDDADKAFFMGAVLMRLSEHLRVRAREDPARSQRLRHLTVVEEAHRLLRRTDNGAAGPAAHAVEMFAAMLAEVRAYGEGLVIAEQIPGKLTPDVIKNTAVKIVHRLPARDDRDSVGATMNLDAAQSRYLVTLPPGHGAVFADGMDRPILVRVPDGRPAEQRTGRLAPVAELLRPRSATCGPDCRAGACTLRQLRSADHLLADQPWLTLWAELAVLAHLTGQPTPVPAPDTRGSLAAVRAVLATRHEDPARTLDCALSHAVDEAVAVRSGTLQPDVDPDRLAGHVCTALRRMVAGEPNGCHSDDLAYLAVPYRWERVRRALKDNPDPDTGPDPRTADWAERYRRVVPGATRAAQLTAVTEWIRADLANVPARTAVAYGTQRPSAVETVIGAGDWRARLTAALGRFVNCSWPASQLTPPK